MGDIVGIADAAGNLIASYTYDAWGKVTSVTGPNTAIAELNPFRYRSYYYDSEIQMYYLQSRYYDAKIRRFINSDDVNYIGITDDELSYNPFTYCGNNAINDYNYYGHFSFKMIKNYFKSLGSKVWELVKKAINEFVWKKGHLGLKMFEIVIDMCFNQLPFAKAFKFVTYKTISNNSF